MKIKTITTATGVNLVDFGDCTSRFYWFRNLGDSTLYVSAKPIPIAGGDDVSELPPKSSTSIETDTGKIYILGAGKVEIHNTDSKFCPFRGNTVSESGTPNSMKWTLYHDPDPYNFLSNTKNTTNYNGSGYNFSGGIPNEFGIYQSYSGYNITHSCAIDFTNVKKIIVNGITKSNLAALSSIAYCHISDEMLTEITDDWALINHSVGLDSSEFSYEIDCASITGEKYIYFAILHGTEDNGNSSYLYVHDIEFIY